MLLEVKLYWPAFLRHCQEHFRDSSTDLSQAAKLAIQVFEENSCLFETTAKQKSDLPPRPVLSPNETRPITPDEDVSSFPTTPITTRRKPDVRRQGYVSKKISFEGRSCCQCGAWAKKSQPRCEGGDCVHKLCEHCMPIDGIWGEDEGDDKLEERKRETNVDVIGRYLESLDRRHRT